MMFGSHAKYHERQAKVSEMQRWESRKTKSSQLRKAMEKLQGDTRMSAESRCLWVARAMMMVVKVI